MSPSNDPVGPVELLGLRQEFTAKVKRVYRLQIVGVILFFATTVGYMLTGLLLSALGIDVSSLSAVLPFVLGAAILGFYLVGRGIQLFSRLRCPVCQGCFQDYGAHCSECGSRSLELIDGSRAARCTGCGAFSKAPGVGTNLYFCTHCGVPLLEPVRKA
jgi:hypothetical protein